MTESLSIREAQKLALLSQRLPPVKPQRAAIEATLSAIQHLGYIQIDTISVIQRAHHHTLWNRNPCYQATQLDQLLADKKVFEYWSHAAAYLPFRDYRFSLVRKNALKRGDQKHWYDRDDRLMKLVLKRIANEGPLMAKDFEHSGKKIGAWKTKPAKRALEYLFMQGDVMVPQRVNFHKVYDLRERVLPEGVNTREPAPEEYARYLITGYLHANGLGQPPEMIYLLKGIKPLLLQTLKEMRASGELLEIMVGDEYYYSLHESLELLHQPLSRAKLKILSPFDNLLIQRKRIKALFGFDYLIECYLPEAKRQYGYFSLPILWDGKLVARMDCKADRKTSILHIKHLAIEPTLKKIDSFLHAMKKELKHFLRFNDCRHLKIHRVSPKKLEAALSAMLND